MLSFALRRKSGESPSAPPIAKIVLATASSRQRPRCRAKAALSILSPRSSSATSTDFAGIAAEIAAASSAIRVAASRARLSGISWISRPLKAEFAADVVESFAIALGQFPFRALLQPADGNDDKAHGRKLSRARADL